MVYWLICIPTNWTEFCFWDRLCCKSKWVCLVQIYFNSNDDSVIWFIPGSIFQTQIDLCWYELLVTCIVLKPVVSQFLSPGPSYHGAYLQDTCGADIVCWLHEKKHRSCFCQVKCHKPSAILLKLVNEICNATMIYFKSNRTIMINVIWNIFRPVTITMWTQKNKTNESFDNFGNRHQWPGQKYALIYFLNNINDGWPDYMTLDMLLLISMTSPMILFYIILITTDYLVRLLLCKKWPYILFQVGPQALVGRFIRHVEWLYESCDSGDIFVISIQIRRSI